MPKLRTSVLSAVFSIILLIGAGTIMFRFLEEWTWAESFYFSVATLTTVGYGDIHPTTDESRVVTALFILVGVGIVIAALTSIGSRYLSTQEYQLSDNITRRMRRQQKKKKRR
jgi:voltage-gated potassium channel Kch